MSLTSSYYKEAIWDDDQKQHAYNIARANMGDEPLKFREPVIEPGWRK